MTKLTKKDITSIFALIQAEFPRSRELDKESWVLRRDLWFTSLSEYSKEEVIKAVYEAINNSEFEPKLKNILDICKRERQPFGVSPNDLWNEVLNTIPYIKEAAEEMRLGNSPAWDNSINGYGKKTHVEKGQEMRDAVFEKLRPEIKRYFGNRPERLARIAEMNTGDLDFEKARFVKTIQPFMEQQAVADKNGLGDYYGLINGFTAKAIADKAVEKIIEETKND